MHTPGLLGLPQGQGLVELSRPRAPKLVALEVDHSLKDQDIRRGHWTGQGSKQPRKGYLLTKLLRITIWKPDLPSFLKSLPHLSPMGLCSRV